MRHARSGKKLGRDMAHRKALYSSLAGAVIEHGRIKTTVTKAKAVKPKVEQLITLGRRGDIHARRQALAFLRSKDVVHKLFSEVGPAFAQRPGGYLRITKIGPRPVFFISAGNSSYERDLVRAYAGASTGPTTVWAVPGAGHTEGLSTRPREYERRVLGFFDRALLGR